MQQLKHLSSLFCGFIVTFLFFSHSGESIYDSPLFRFILWSLSHNKSALSKINSFPFIFSSKYFRYLCKRDSKSSLIIRSVSLPITISILPLLVCMVQVSSESLEEIKLMTFLLNFPFFLTFIINYCIAWMNFPFSLSFMINYYITLIWFNHIKILFNQQSFVFISFTFIFNIIIIKDTNSFLGILIIFINW